MSFSNPFDQQLAAQDTVSIEYFSGNPNPQTLDQPEVVMIFKNLLRKDQTTREKASTAFLNTLDNIEITDAVHLAWIQLYVKLCFDISTVVRTNSHQILGKMYQILGKKSTKYLKDSLACLLCGLYDPVQSVVTAANEAFELTFNTSERRELVIKKFTGEIEQFCENVLLVITPQTLSDERYISKEESLLKYNRVVKQVLDLVTNVLVKHSDEIPLLDNTKTWKLMANTDPMVARAALGLATAAINKVDTLKVYKQIIKTMNKPLPQSSVELVRSLLTYTKAHPDYWDTTSQTALVNYVKSGSQYPKPFWPLFFNLALLVTPDKALLSALASVAIKISGPTQNDVWGCFLTLCGRSKLEEAPKIAVSSIASRSESNINQETVEFIAARFKNIPTTDKLLEPHLKIFNFVRILAATGQYTSTVSQSTANFTLAQVAQLVKYDPNLVLEIDTNDEDFKSLLDIAVHSNTVDAQSIASKVMEKDPELVLEYSCGLSRRNVSLDLSSSLNLTSADTLKKAISAHGGLVDDQTASGYVLSLATSATEGNAQSLKTLAEVSQSDPKFVQQVLGNTDLGSRLLNELHLQKQSDHVDSGLESLFSTLTVNDSSDLIVEELLKGDIQNNLDVLVGRATKANTSTAEFAKLLLTDQEWLPNNFWPGVAGSTKYPVRYPVEDLPDSSDITRVISIGIYLINLIHSASDDQFNALSAHEATKCITDIALLSTACIGLEYGCTSDITVLAQALRTETQQLVLRVDQQSLWELVSSSDSSSAYYAAQLLYPRRKNQDNAKFCQQYRSQLDDDSICAALLTQLHAGLGIHWYDRSQRTKYDDLSSGKQIESSAFSCIDSKVDSEKFKDLLHELTESVDEPLLQDVLLRLVELDHKPELPENSIERILEYGLPASQLIVLATLSVGEFDREVVKAAARLRNVETEQDHEVVSAFLAYSRQLVHKDLGFNFNKSCTDASIGWVFYCCKRGRSIAKYRQQLESSKFTDTSINISFGSQPDWLLYLDLVAEHTRMSQSSGKKSAASTTTFSEYENLNREILDYVGDKLKQGDLSYVSSSLKCEEIDEVIGDADASTVTLFYRMCTLFGTFVRQWYRENNDRTLQSAVDQCLETQIVPATMRSLTAQVQGLRQDGLLESTSVSERGREFRAMIEVDETIAQIVITLDPLFPVKNASVELIGLDGVPEHKKRSWMIEAEYSVQNGSIVNAMRTLILKVNNFLEGIEPCAICYSVMEGKNLPTKVCTTCKNKYHTECLYKWFSSNKGEKNCPMCRAKMG